jgi:hypothetical protein
MQKNVKLTAKPNTWFKTGTEAYHYDSAIENPRRLTLEEWEEMVKDGIYCLRGIRVSESENELTPIGTEYFDGECGCPDEFEVEIL